MEIGLTFFPTAESIRPDSLGRAAEERGFESVWLAEHSHIPVSPMTPGPPEPGQPGLPREYYAVADPFVGLAMMATATEKLRLGTGICLVPQRDVFQTAKQVASLDVFSGGRFHFGIGAGWNQPEVEDHGTAFGERFAVMRERIEAMKALWSDEKAEYHGEHVDFAPAFAWPKPVQRPHPPIHVGGAGAPAIRRAVRYGDGWIPLWADGAPLGLIPELHSRARDAGRDPEALPVTIYWCPSEPGPLARCREAGVARALFMMPSIAEADALRELDRLREVASKLE